MTMHPLRVIRCIVLTVTWLAIPAWQTAAQTITNRAEPAPPDRWQFISSPMMWFTGIEGDLTIHGITADVDLGFEDLFDATKYGFTAYLELRKRKFGFYAVPSYTRLEGDGQAGLLGVDFEQDFWLVEAGGFYNLVHTKNNRPFTLDAMAGIRYLNVSTDADVEGLGPAGRHLSLSSSTKLLDPVIGLRVNQYLTKRLSLHGHGDVGGFGISEGDTSDLSWQVVGLVGYDLSRRFTAYAGYRLLGIDTSEGSGSDENGFDLKMHGALMGLAVKW